MSLTDEQAAPVANDGASIWGLVIADMQDRERIGIAAADLALVHGRDDVGEPGTALLVLHHRKHGLSLGASDFRRLAGNANCVAH